MKLSRYKHSSSMSYALGATLTYELLKTHPEAISRVFLRPQNKYGEDLKKLLLELKQRRISVTESSKAFNTLAAKDNCLVIAEFKKTATSLDGSAETPHIVLVNPSDSGNLGTIMRTALAFDYMNIAIITPAVDYLDPKTIRASMGAIFHLNIETFPSFENYLTKYGQISSNSREQKRTLYSFMLNRDSKSLTDIKPRDYYFALIFGNEATGLPKSFAESTDTIFIPQTPLVDSLNLAIAASLGMYHFRTELQNH